MTEEAVRPTSFAIHHWAGSWLKVQVRTRREGGGGEGGWGALTEGAVWTACMGRWKPAGQGAGAVKTFRQTVRQ
eukprot:750549-Hanusia_phi.AAC.9